MNSGYEISARMFLCIDLQQMSAEECDPTTGLKVGQKVNRRSASLCTNMHQPHNVGYI